MVKKTSKQVPIYIVLLGRFIVAATTRHHRIVGVLIYLLAMPVFADSSSPRLAAYYEDFMAICGDQVYEWTNSNAPKMALSGIRQVGVGKSNRYGLTQKDQLLVWYDDPNKAAVVMDQVQSFHAGQSGLLVVRQDGSLWSIETKSFLGLGERLSAEPIKIAENVLTASVGDSANYYVTREGALFVKGKAHRGQYGDGRLTATDQFVQTATDVARVAAHTGHALVLKNDGSVWGTGGNIYGPLGDHGYGDKATRWGLLHQGASEIATGSSHSLAINKDRSLWIWGRNEGLEPRRVMSSVSAVAAGRYDSIALSKGVLWQWRTGEPPTQLMPCK